MPKRRPKKVAPVEPVQPTGKLAGFIGKRKPKAKKRKPAAGPSTIARFVSELDEMIEEQAFNALRPGHHVALFIQCHRQVYGVAADIAGDEWRGACSAVSRTITNEFKGDHDLFMTFHKWVWRRESKTEKWRRENNKPGRVLSWRLVFSKRLITEFKIAKVREMS